MSIMDYIEDICDELNISVPEISHDTSHFPTDTTLAQCCPEDNSIIFPTDSEINPSFLFSIAHELRHLFQYKNGILTPESYQSSDNLSIEEYNQQYVEIDANAYALTVMEDFFGITMTLENLSGTTKSMIKNRALEIRNELEAGE